MTFLPTPVNGKIPIWVVAAWNWPKSMARALQYEVIMPGDDPEKAASIVRLYAEAGVIWWVEAIWEPIYSENSLERIRTRIQQGPPRLD